MRMKHLALAGAALMLSVGSASAAVVTHGLNLRTGPSTRYRVMDTMPAGAHVRVLNCTSYWCRVSFRGMRGWASRNFLAGARRYYARRYYYRSYPYYGYGHYGSYAYAPGFSIGIGFGSGWPYWYHGPRYHRYRYRHRYWRY
ncbi:MAG: SH3 domain-containing protein [Pseudolabrys sp.]